jgi:hypothetical protein
VRNWTTLTPDGRRLVIGGGAGAWEVSCGGDPPVTGERLDVVLIEAVLFSQGFVLHASRPEHTSWAWALADEIEHGQRPADGEPPN